jgi:hypothetical protein
MLNHTVPVSTNDFTTDDYDDAVATMHAVAKRMDVGLYADMVELRKRSFLHPPDPEKLSMFLHLLGPITAKKSTYPKTGCGTTFSRIRF